MSNFISYVNGPKETRASQPTVIDLNEDDMDDEPRSFRSDKEEIQYLRTQLAATKRQLYSCKTPPQKDTYLNCTENNALIDYLRHEKAEMDRINDDLRMQLDNTQKHMRDLISQADNSNTLSNATAQSWRVMAQQNAREFQESRKRLEESERYFFTAAKDMRKRNGQLRQALKNNLEGGAETKGVNKGRAEAELATAQMNRLKQELRETRDAMDVFCVAVQKLADGGDVADVVPRFQDLVNVATRHRYVEADMNQSDGMPMTSADETRPAGYDAKSCPEPEDGGRVK